MCISDWMDEQSLKLAKVEQGCLRGIGLAIGIQPG